MLQTIRRFAGIGLVVLVQFAVLPLHAESQEIDIANAETLSVKGYKGQLKVKVNPQTKKLKVTSKKSTKDGWSVQVSRRSGGLMIEVVGPSDRSDWMDALEGKTIGSTDVEIESPSLPLDIAWREGQVQIREWMSSVQVLMIEGSLVVEGSNGDLQADVHSGGVKISKQKGAVRIQGFDPTIEIFDTEGALKIENYTGVTRIFNPQGATQLVAHRGPMNIQQGKGRIDVANDRANIRIEEFEGSLRGQSAIGNVLAKLKGDIDVQLKSEEGDVRLKVPESGADVSVATEKGQLIVPGFLQTYRTETIKSARGRLRGSNPGRIHVRSQTGSVQLN